MAQGYLARAVLFSRMEKTVELKDVMNEAYVAVSESISADEQERSTAEKWRQEVRASMDAKLRLQAVHSEYAVAKSAASEARSRRRRALEQYGKIATHVELESDPELGSADKDVAMKACLAVMRRSRTFEREEAAKRKVEKREFLAKQDEKVREHNARAATFVQPEPPPLPKKAPFA